MKNRSKQTVLKVAIVLSAVIANADDVTDLRPRLAEASASKAADYVRLRDSLIRDVETNRLHLAASDARLDWRERLVARIALERKLRKDDIEALRSYDWFSDPEFSPMWLQMLSGVAGHMSPLAFRRFSEAGLWYYYVEINWKDTGERSVEPRQKRIYYTWPFYGIGGLREEPEYIYLPMVRSERIREDSPFGKEYFRRNYDGLMKEIYADAVPALVERFESSCGDIPLGSFELVPGAIERGWRGRFNRIIAIADQRHTDLLDAYITEHPVLEPLRVELDAVRQRPAPEPTPEPPFRVMPTPEFLKNPPPRRDPSEARWPVFHFKQSDPPPEPEEAERSNE